jgi:hypothetical protein
MTIYVTQYGTWWRLTPEQWRSVCHQGQTGRGYVLPRAGQLKRRPGAVVGATDYNDGESRTSYYPRRNNVYVFEPLDWEPSEFADALLDLDARQRVAGSTS